MCGLFGLLGGAEPLPEDLLLRARASLARLAHRGPDQSGEFVQHGLYVGHRRLSILDVSEHGRQPMVAPSGSVVIAVNGEIYNFRELRRELGAHRFHSNSDSEVVLHGYETWGIDGLLRRMEGMYAGVIADLHSRKLYLFRDRVGIKPLYYARIGKQFAWASELKAIEMFFGRDRLRIDPTALYDFLTYRYVPSPKSVYVDVSKLEPASVLEFSFDDGKQQVREYWQLSCNVVADDRLQNAAPEIADTLQRNVVSQLVADVPIGFFLSGGIDSSSIVALAVKAGAQAQAFSMGFDVAGHDETKFAAVVADQLSIPLSIRRMQQAEAIDLVPWLRDMFDEPFADASALATYHLAAFTRESVKVALSGDGGDELFAGYASYSRYSRLQPLRSALAPMLPAAVARLPFAKRPRTRLQKLKDLAVMIAQPEDLSLFQTLSGGISLGERLRYRGVLGIPDDYDDLWSFRRHYRPELGRIRSLQYIDFKTYLPDDILTKVDRVTMAVGLEARVPFLGTEVVELAFSLPEHFHFAHGHLKAGLKMAVQSCVPDQVLRRPKKGFGLPAHVWGRSYLRGSRATLVESVLDDSFGITA